MNGNECCACGCGCCEPPKKQVRIDFLYLDLDVCDRCIGTENALDGAIADVRQVLVSAGFEMIVNKTLIDTRDKAVAMRLLTSPTIRVNGQDIDTQFKETKCECCGELCGEDVDCRVWTYNGESYTVPPKALIVDAILRSVYGKASGVTQAPYAMPKNLEKYFQAITR